MRDSDRRLRLWDALFAAAFVQQLAIVRYGQCDDAAAKEARRRAMAIADAGLWQLDNIGELKRKSRE